MPSGPHLQPARRRVLGSSSILEPPARVSPMVPPAPGQPADPGLSDDPAVELARLQAELEALQERARLAEAAQKRDAACLRAAFLDLTEAARAELSTIEAAHEAAVGALAAEARALPAGLSTISAPRAADAPPLGGP